MLSNTKRGIFLLASPQWIFDRAPASGAVQGGDLTAHVIAGTLDHFSREALQNSRDQRRPGEIVDVRFSLIALEGQEKFDFLDAMGWSSDLERHIEGANEAGSGTIKRRLQQGLALANRDDAALLLLRIDDSGTVGLTGGEDEKTGNFNLL
jgi:hypothetical protein